jgi:penicillin amidase
LVEDFFGSEVPKPLREFVAGKNSGVPLLIAVLEKPDRTWFGEKPIEGRNRLLQQTFVRAVAQTKKALGEDPRQWSWGKLHTAPFRHPLARLGPAYAQAFNMVSVPRGGDGLTANARPYNERLEQVHVGPW